MPTSESPAPIRIGISSCLLGQKVRFDGNHKQDGFITGTLSEYFEFVPACPEIAIGMGVPREPIQLVGDADAPRALGVKDPSQDFTDKLAAYGARMAEELGEISGYILKSKSPSCGMERVKLYAKSNQPSNKKTRGIYATAIMQAKPLLPVEEEGRLNDPVLRENFIERVFAYRRWQDLAAAGFTMARLVEFHTTHKMTLLAHGTENYRRLGRLVANEVRRSPRALAKEYAVGFMEAMRHRATRKRHTNVLMHLMGYLKKVLDSDDKRELLEVIENYRLGYVPLIVPITLLKHYFRRFPDPYVARQVYLNPHPQELMLRNHV